MPNFNPTLRYGTSPYNNSDFLQRKPLLESFIMAERPKTGSHIPSALFWKHLCAAWPKLTRSLSASNLAFSFTSLVQTITWRNGIALGLLALNSYTTYGAATFPITLSRVHPQSNDQCPCSKQWPSTLHIPHSAKFLWYKISTSQAKVTFSWFMKHARHNFESIILS